MCELKIFLALFYLQQHSKTLFSKFCLKGTYQIVHPSLQWLLKDSNVTQGFGKFSLFLCNRTVFRILPNICDGDFCDNSQQLLALNYFRSCLIGSQIRPCIDSRQLTIFSWWLPVNFEQISRIILLSLCFSKVFTSTGNLDVPAPHQSI